MARKIEVEPNALQEPEHEEKNAWIVAGSILFTIGLIATIIALVMCISLKQTLVNGPATSEDASGAEAAASGFAFAFGVGIILVLGIALDGVVGIFDLIFTIVNAAGIHNYHSWRKKYVIGLTAGNGTLLLINILAIVLMLAS